jgi:hypothetical protein
MVSFFDYIRGYRTCYICKVKDKKSNLTYDIEKFVQNGYRSWYHTSGHHNNLEDNINQSIPLEKEVETIKPTEIKPSQTDFINPWEINIPKMKGERENGI